MNYKKNISMTLFGYRNQEAAIIRISLELISVYIHARVLISDSWTQDASEPRTVTGHLLINKKIDNISVEVKAATYLREKRSSAFV